jgi:hypothetical protein
VEAQQSMVNAVVQETRGSATAELAAEKMIQAATKKTDEILAKATEKIKSLENVATKEVMTSRKKADIVQREENDAEAHTQTKTKNNTEALVVKLKTLSSQSQMIAAATEADNVAKMALEDARKAKVNLDKSLSKMDQLTGAVHVLVSKTVESVVQLSNGRGEDIKAMSAQLSTIGAKAASEIKAKERGDTIRKKTADAAEVLNGKVQTFQEAVQKIVSDMETTGNETTSRIGALVADTKAKGEDVVQRLTENALLAQQTLEGAKFSWMAADVQAVKGVDDAATGVGIGVAISPTVPASAEGEAAGEQLAEPRIVETVSEKHNSGHYKDEYDNSMVNLRYALMITALMVGPSVSVCAIILAFRAPKSEK